MAVGSGGVDVGFVVGCGGCHTRIEINRWLEGAKVGKHEDQGRNYSALKRSLPLPPLITAFIKVKKRSEYSAGGTGLILCYNTPRLSTANFLLEKESSPGLHSDSSKNAPSS